VKFSPGRIPQYLLLVEATSGIKIEKRIIEIVEAIRAEDLLRMKNLKTINKLILKCKKIITS